jgi:hypothetical protein
MRYFWRGLGKHRLLAGLLLVGITGWAMYAGTQQASNQAAYSQGSPRQGMSGAKILQTDTLGISSEASSSSQTNSDNQPQNDNSASGSPSSTAVPPSLPAGEDSSYPKSMPCMQSAANTEWPGCFPKGCTEPMADGSMDCSRCGVDMGAQPACLIQ